jgi:hypothetical protein
VWSAAIPHAETRGNVPRRALTFAGGLERTRFVDFRADDEDWVPRGAEAPCQALYDRGCHRTDRIRD